MKPQAVLLDDGELDDLRALFRELDVDYCDARRAAFGERVPLLLSSPKYARALADGAVGAPPHQLHVVVCDDAAESGAPSDFTLVRPLDAGALRLMTRRWDLEGPERRLATRVALGVPVKVRVADDQREVIVERISSGGCGLVSQAPLRPGLPLEIELPSELTAPRTLVLTGRVLASREVTTADGLTFDVSVAFEPLDLADRVTLRALMARHAIDYRPPTEGPARNGSLGLRSRVRPPDLERSGLRRRFYRRVLGACDGTAQVLMARELSLAGLGVEPHERLAPGKRVRLALYDGADLAPLLLETEVWHLDAADGVFLKFETLDLEDAARLEALLKTLAPIDLDHAPKSTA